MLGSFQGSLLFVGYAIFILAVVFYTRKKNESIDDFLVMNRDMGFFKGMMSVAVSWLWAPAIFICSLQAYTQGLPGIFWFTAPNILCFFLFIPIALKLRETIPNGYTMPQLFKLRFEETRLPHFFMTVAAFGYQLGAIIINCVAGAILINLLSGIPYHVGVLMMGGLALSYSLISGLRASVMSDVAQMAMILVFVLFLVPWAFLESGGIETVKLGLSGVTGEFGNIFDPKIAYAFGIATSIALLSGPMLDQMFTQRVFAAKKRSIKKIFFFGGLIFGIIPIMLSLLGFIGAAEVKAGNLIVSDPQMVGPIVIGQFLPEWALMLFAVMAFAGLTSTLDSAFTAIGSITTTDIYKGKKVTLKVARLGMLIMAVIGMAISMLKPDLLWIFLIYGALGGSTFFPIILTLFWRKITANAVALGIALGLIISVPLSIYANVTGNVDLIVLSSISGVGISGIVTVLGSYLMNKRA